MTLSELADQLWEGTEWHLRAACRPSRARFSQVDDRVFLPALGEYDRRPALASARALALCARCETRAECAALADLCQPRCGIWAGQYLTVKKKGKGT